MKAKFTSNNRHTDEEIERGNSVINVIDWLRAKGLLKVAENMVCECGSTFTEINDLESNDLRRFKCSDFVGCGENISIRTNCIFFGLKIPLTTIYNLLFNAFVKNMSIHDAVDKYVVSLQTVINYFQYARQVIREIFLH
jgi:hypothetical protein